MNLTLKKNIGWLTILVLATLPILIWLIMQPLPVRFFDINSAMTSLGQITGLLGMALFSINLILSSRLKILDKYFYGLDTVYNYHRVLGAISFSLLLFHPLFLVFKYISFSLRQAALFFIFSDNQAMNFGIMALALMIILISVTFYFGLKYHIWKFTHKFMVAVFVFAILHSIYIASDISRNNFLRYYILSLAIAGLLAGIYRAFISKYFNVNFFYIIKNINQLSSDVFQLTMTPKNKVLNFKPGQFVFTSFLGQAISSEIHPFSISSAHGQNLELVIKSLGDFTSQLKSLAVGDQVSVEGPFGKFSYTNGESKNQIWLAGGIGITPFLSMARSLQNNDYKIDLYYCTKDKEEAVLLDELLNISKTNENLKIIPWYSAESGRINSQKVADISHGLTNKDIFLCGPAVFMDSLKKQFISLGVNKKNIHLEQFKFL